MICADCKIQEKRNIGITVTEDRMRIVVCDAGSHYPLTFYACCENRAIEYAEDFCFKTFQVSVEPTEVWVQGDIDQPSVILYPNNHTECQVIPDFTISVGAA